MNSTSTQRAPKNGTLAGLYRDIVACLVLAVLFLCIHELVSPFVRGFHCNDETIRYPHKESTVPSIVCYAVGSGINVLLILFLEYQLLLSSNSIENSGDEQDKLFYKHYLRNVYCRILIFVFGGIASEMITDIAKVTSGRLRPHFIDVCKPKINTLNGRLDYEEFCMQSPDKFRYITDYECSGKSSNLRDIRLSFMSGHSSYSSYSATFAVLYLQKAMETEKYGLIRPVLQVLLVSLAFYTGLSRVSDYKHHWQDVLAGLLQGAFSAIIISMFLWPSFSKLYTKYSRSSNQREGRMEQELRDVSY